MRILVEDGLERLICSTKEMCSGLTQMDSLDHFIQSKTGRVQLMDFEMAETKCIHIVVKGSPSTLIKKTNELLSQKDHLEFERHTGTLSSSEKMESFDKIEWPLPDFIYSARYYWNSHSIILTISKDWTTLDYSCHAHESLDFGIKKIVVDWTLLSEIILVGIETVVFVEDPIESIRKAEKDGPFPLIVVKGNSFRMISPQFNGYKSLSEEEEIVIDMVKFLSYDDRGQRNWTGHDPI